MSCVTIVGITAHITLPCGRIAIVDACDADRVAAISWNRHRKRGHIAGRVAGRAIALHRFIMGARRGEVVDHRDGDALNNQRANLRIASAADNAANSVKKRQGHASSRYKGVYFSKRPMHRRIPWIAFIRKQYLGNFATELEAATAYDNAARAEWGAFACVNFPQEGERSALAPPTVSRVRSTSRFAQKVSP